VLVNPVLTSRQRVAKFDRRAARGGLKIVFELAVRTWSEYHAALTTLNRASAFWQRMPSHELEAST
jgi:hypothetical protein